MDKKRKIVPNLYIRYQKINKVRLGTTLNFLQKAYTSGCRACPTAKKNKVVPFVGVGKFQNEVVPCL
jgi:hypothetical protein